MFITTAAAPLKTMDGLNYKDFRKAQRLNATTNFKKSHTAEFKLQIIKYGATKYSRKNRITRTDANSQCDNRLAVETELHFFSGVEGIKSKTGMNGFTEVE